MSIPSKIKGTVVLKLHHPTDPVSATIQLITANVADSSGKGKLGNTASFKGVFDNHQLSGDNQITIPIYFDYDPESFGIPGAFIIKSLFTPEFFLVSLNLEDIPNVGNIYFDCNSWINDLEKFPNGRLFFTNQTYLPSETPAPLVFYRQFELQSLRGDGTGERKKWERIYEYAFYNDLGNPDKDPSLARPVAGGSTEVPYPRRCRTGRPPTNADPNSESPSELPYYIPRDEIAVELVFEATREAAVRKIHSVPTTEDEFHTFDDVFELFETGQYPLPQVVQVNKSAWVTDEEFAREIIAGVNPGIIRNIKDLPSKVKQHYKSEVFQNTKLFVLDYNETLLPHLRRINSLGSHVYASKTYLYLANDGTLKPLAIELTRPNPDGDGFVTEVYFPATEGTVEGSIWQLAKAYAVVNDECVHQIISHWLHTHAVTEPFVLAANRQLSVVHPIYKLLRPHFRNTMHINAAARKLLLNAGGAVEQIYAWGDISVEMSSILYKDWVFPEQALPVDLIKRGMAVEDESSPHGIQLLIKDYPYAVDGLDIWGALKTWVQEYVYLYYTSDDTVQQDYELQAWWNEVVKVGHGDKKNAEWWSKMQTREDLIQSCVTIMWISSVLHASVNFSQYPYGALILNRPTLSRRFMPKEGTAEYEELVNNPELAYLNTITSKPTTIVDLNMLELLSTHSSDEYYLGQRESALHWTSDPKALEAFRKFGKAIAVIEDNINQRNADNTLKNRVGPVVMPYTLLYPTSGEGITFKGVPNSISI